MTNIVNDLRLLESGARWVDTAAADTLERAADEIERLRDACTKMNTEVCQRLGKALGYPWFKDDQENFPGATEENGVCTGEHVAESIAAEAARRIDDLEAERDRLRVRHSDYMNDFVLLGMARDDAEAERDRLRRCWMRVLQEENSCEPTGNPCKSKRCGCLAELEALVKEAGHEADE